MLRERENGTYFLCYYRVFSMSHNPDLTFEQIQVKPCPKWEMTGQLGRVVILVSDVVETCSNRQYFSGKKTFPLIDHNIGVAIKKNLICPLNLPLIKKRKKSFTLYKNHTKYYNWFDGGRPYNIHISIHSKHVKPF